MKTPSSFADPFGAGNPDESGFSMMEMMVVLLIIGLLAAIAIPLFLNQRKLAVDATVTSDVKNVATVIETMAIADPTDDLSMEKVRQYSARNPDDSYKLSGENALIVMGSTRTGFCAIGYNPNGFKFTAPTSPQSYDSRAGGLGKQRNEQNPDGVCSSSLDIGGGHDFSAIAGPELPNGEDIPGGGGNPLDPQPYNPLDPQPYNPLEPQQPSNPFEPQPSPLDPQPNNPLDPWGSDTGGGGSLDPQSPGGSEIPADGSGSGNEDGVNNYRPTLTATTGYPNGTVNKGEGEGHHNVTVRVTFPGQVASTSWDDGTTTTVTPASSNIREADVQGDGLAGYDMFWFFDEVQVGPGIDSKRLLTVSYTIAETGDRYTHNVWFDTNDLSLYVDEQTRQEVPLYSSDEAATIPHGVQQR